MAHVDTAIFESWLAETFLTELLRRRELHHYGGPLQFLLLDNLFRGISDRDFSPSCENTTGCFLCFFPPHRSKSTPSFGFCSIFGMTKRIYRPGRNPEEHPKQSTSLKL
jgi:hypothetical protein